MGMICCFGELLLRLSPAADGQWMADHSMPVYIGGAELNAATALSGWGLKTRYCTALPDHYLADQVLSHLVSKGIDTGGIHRSGERIGIYYLPVGSELKNAGVIYDRAHSSFAELKPGMINWNQVLEGCHWFHFSAISPALQEQSAAVCLEALLAAKARGLTVSIDLNYRARLWQYGRQPTEIMPALVEHCDLIMGNLWAAHALLGISVDPDIHAKGTTSAYLEHARTTALQIMKEYPKCRKVAQTFRFEAAGELTYYASLDTPDRQFLSDVHRTNAVVDKVGSGDCFMGGLIFGTNIGMDDQQTLRFAASAAFGKLHEKGDATAQSVEVISSRIQS